MPPHKRHPEVDDFIAHSSHALAHCLQPLREIIHAAHSDITEQIKWKCPSFCFEEDDRVTFNVSNKNLIRLILHTGAKGKGNIPDKSKFTNFQFLEWPDNNRAIVTISGAHQLSDISGSLSICIALWIKETVKQL